MLKIMNHRGLFKLLVTILFFCLGLTRAYHVVPASLVTKSTFLVNNPLKKSADFTRKFSRINAIIISEESPSKSGNMNRIQVLQEKLAASGRAGLLAYGILNCFYYISVTAITCYITLKKYPFVINRGATFLQRVQFVLSRLGSVAGTVWVGSQITKIFRLSGAVICAPVVDNLMMQCQKYFKLPSRNAAFWFIVAMLWATVILFYSSLVVYGTSTLYMSALETIL